MWKPCCQTPGSRDAMSHEGDETGRGQKNKKRVSHYDRKFKCVFTFHNVVLQE